MPLVFFPPPLLLLQSRFFFPLFCCFLGQPQPSQLAVQGQPADIPTSCNHSAVLLSTARHCVPNQIQPIGGPALTGQASSAQCLKNWAVNQVIPGSNPASALSCRSGFRQAALPQPQRPTLQDGVNNAVLHYRTFVDNKRMYLKAFKHLKAQYRCKGWCWCWCLLYASHDGSLPTRT